MSTITLTRAEALAVSRNLIYTGGCALDENYEERGGCYRAIRRLQLEAAINDAGGWWEPDRDPGMLAMYEQLGGASCPDSFEFAAEGLPALVELLPAILARSEDTFPDPDEDVDEEHRSRLEANRAALRGLAARLGVEIPQEVQA